MRYNQPCNVCYSVVQLDEWKASHIMWPVICVCVRSSPCVALTPTPPHGNITNIRWDRIPTGDNLCHSFYYYSISVEIVFLLLLLPANLRLSNLSRLSGLVPNRSTCFSEWTDWSSSRVAFLLRIRYTHKHIYLLWRFASTSACRVWACVNRTSQWVLRPRSCSLDQMLWTLPACSGWRLLSPHVHWCFCIWPS